MPHIARQDLDLKGRKYLRGDLLPEDLPIDYATWVDAGRFIPADTTQVTALKKAREKVAKTKAEARLAEIDLEDAITALETGEEEAPDAE